MISNKVSVYAVGDTRPNWPTPETLFELSLPTLRQADILFGNLEAVLSEKGESQLQAPDRKMSPHRVSGLVHARFDVMSFASNHTMDRGEQGLLETIDTLTKNNIAVIGAGRNIGEARKPFILERKGTKVGFLGYCSVLPKGYEAEPDKSGCASMRAYDAYEKVDAQPGTPPRIWSLANKDDLAAMLGDIKKLRPLVDVLILSMHWGIHFAPALIAMYQKEIGFAAIDAGVDVILGHHPHILKGIEVYKGKVIFYSLGNFVMPHISGSYSGRNAVLAFYNVKQEPDSHYPYGIVQRKTIIAKCSISNKKIERVSFFPVMINKQAQPEVLRRQDKRFDEVASYMKEITESQDLNAKYQVDGDEVVISN